MEHIHLESKCLTKGYKTFYGPGCDLASQSYFLPFPKTHIVPHPEQFHSMFLQAVVALSSLLLLMSWLFPTRHLVIYLYKPSPPPPHWCFPLPANAYACSVTQSCLTLCNHTDCSPPGSSVYRIFQPRILEWVSYSRGSFWPRDQTHVSCFLHWHGDSVPLCYLKSPLP